MHQVKSSHSYSYCDIDSDHVLKVAKCDISFRKFKKINKHRWYIERLKELAFLLLEIQMERFKDSITTWHQVVVGKIWNDRSYV